MALIVVVVLVGAVVLVAARGRSTTDRSSPRSIGGAGTILRSSTSSTEGLGWGPATTDSVELEPIVGPTPAGGWEREPDDPARAIGDLKDAQATGRGQGAEPLLYLSFFVGSYTPGRIDANKWDAGASARWTRGDEYLRVSVVHFLDRSIARSSAYSPEATVVDHRRELTASSGDLAAGGGSTPTKVRKLATVRGIKDGYAVVVSAGSPTADLSDQALAAAQAAWDRLP